ncbi:MAG: tryptophan--tRNA ligase [Candidatus Omnitrophica bacterium]|nr:tryptophan--tRNA ligase [Candidatus Omnitrophota bacterium]MDD5513538.1 tryptophan--tRNA ligase [Candidatus Omnitrophota bacterium]
MHKKRILSGMRPTGKLHLGHLVGALDNWIKLQSEYECFFMVADWHALMSEYEDPQNLKSNIIDNVIDWLACGVSPEKCTIFIQSQVREHLELYFIFSIITPLGWLERCPTYKEQLREVKGRDLSTYGFLGYPVLQAADILLYKAQAVPVGEDQLPHLELTREIARRFNSLYKEKIFPEAEALLTKSSRLMGLDGRKMSKSYNNVIALSEDPQEIRNKIKGMFTDPQRVRRSDPGHPEKCNVHSYFSLFAPQRAQEIAQACRKAEIGCTECKKELAEIVVNFLAPIQQKRQELSQDRRKILDLLESGRQRASVIAEETIREAKKKVNLE